MNNNTRKRPRPPNYGLDIPFTLPINRLTRLTRQRHPPHHFHELDPLTGYWRRL